MRKNFTCNVAGVTFANEDGVNRQGILRELVDAKKEICGISLKKTNYTDNNGVTQMAIACIEKTSRQQIGFIPKENITEILKDNCNELTAFIGYNTKGKCYYVELSPVQAPTKNQYVYVQRACKKAGIPMPAYDERAYKRWFSRESEDERNARLAARK